MAQYVSISRIVNGLAVCESDDRSIVDLALSELPAGVREGDILRVEDGKYCLDPGEAERRRTKAKALQDLAFGGDD